MKRKQMQTRNAQQPDRENGEAGSLRHKSSESNSRLKEGGTTPNFDNFDSDLGDGDSDGDRDEDVYGKEVSIAPNFGDIDGNEGSKTPPYDGDGDGDGNGNRRSRHQ